MLAIAGSSPLRTRADREANGNYEITIVDRHATVVLNGEKVIDNQPVIGNQRLSGGRHRPGPLHLQGDHTSVRYRNVVLYPVLGQTGG